MLQSITGLSVPRGVAKLSFPRLPISSRSSHTNAMRGLTVDTLNPAILNVQYAVRGELAIKAEEYRVRLKAGAHDLPFDKVISSNIGNPQQAGLDQPPITFNRQVGPATVSGTPSADFTPLFGNLTFYFILWVGRGAVLVFAGAGGLRVGIVIGGGIDGVACTR